MKMQGPVQVKIEVKLIKNNGKQIGTATLPMDCFSYPTKQEIKDEVSKFVENGMPEDFRLMTKKEAFNSAWREITGSSESVSCGSDKWDD